MSRYQCQYLGVVGVAYYSRGCLWLPHPWKHFVKRLDSLFFNVRKSLRGRSGCLIRICWM